MIALLELVAVFLLVLLLAVVLAAFLLMLAPQLLSVLFLAVLIWLVFLVRAFLSPAEPADRRSQTSKHTPSRRAEAAPYTFARKQRTESVRGKRDGVQARLLSRQDLGGEAAGHWRERETHQRMAGCDDEVVETARPPDHWKAVGRAGPKSAPNSDHPPARQAGQIPSRDEDPFDSAPVDAQIETRELERAGKA